MVYNAGFSCTMEEERKIEMCYWQNLRGVRQSALFPGHAAAWRDALRVHDEAVDAVKQSPGVHRFKQSMPADQSAELSGLKQKAIKAGYTFNRSRNEDFFTFDGCKVTGFKSHADCVRDAVRHWARRDPSSFCAAMDLNGWSDEATGLAPDFKDWGPLASVASSIHDDKPMPTFTVGARDFLPPLTADELAELQGFPGYDEMPDAHKRLTTQARQMLKMLHTKGINLDLSKLAGTVEEAVGVTYKSQGKTFEEVEEAQRNATRAYGLVEGSAEEGQLRHLEKIGYEFYFTSTHGWLCKQIDRSKASGALETVVKAAWAMAVSENSAAWEGVGQPPVGTTLWVIPHNTIWGFAMVDTYLCEVLAYHNDHVWLQLLSDTGEVVLGQYVTTRIDKVDVKVWKGNKDA